VSRSDVHGLILERALLGAMAAMVPVPLIDDALLRRSRRALFQTIAEAGKLRLDRDSLAAFVAAEDRTLARSAGVSLVSRILRGAALPIRVAGRARTALDTFQLATLLDHYARAHHQGLDLDAERAKALRRAFDEVIAETRLRWSDLRHPADHAASLKARFDEHWARRPEAAR
jgi:hypothetical protein